jgi:hypothetical protein
MRAVRRLDIRAVRRLLKELEAERAARPKRPITAVRIEARGEPVRRALLCRECYQSIEEPTRVSVVAPAPHAQSCDWCHCLNAEVSST